MRNSVVDWKNSTRAYDFKLVHEEAPKSKVNKNLWDMHKATRRLEGCNQVENWKFSFLWKPDLRLFNLG